MSKTFVLAPDSFKESITAQHACQAMQRGIEKVFPDALFIHVPMADGGEGTVDALITALNGQRIECEVTGPLAIQKVKTYFGLVNEGKTAIIEMAKANGIHLLNFEQRNPLLTSTFGTGEMIKQALDLGVSQIIVGLGGSVTNDAGAGMAQALGVKFLDANQCPMLVTGGRLDQIHQIDVSALDSRLKNVEMMIASDVNNPLCGENGASAVFAPQKGATPDQVKYLDRNLYHFAALVKQNLGLDRKDDSGAGAAGGLGYGLMVFANATLRSGIELMIEQTQLAEKMVQADYVFTGEGGIDFQTQFGKTPLGVAKLAKQYGKPVIACAGYIGEGVETLYAEGFDAIFGILGAACDLPTALNRGEQNLERTCENIARLLKLSNAGS